MLAESYKKNAFFLHSFGSADLDPASPRCGWKILINSDNDPGCAVTREAELLYFFFQSFIFQTLCKKIYRKEPKHEIFVAKFFAQPKLVWVSDSESTQKYVSIFDLGLVFAILFFTT
jgi:hypothetical protein